MKKAADLAHLKKLVQGIERGDFEIVEYAATAIPAEPGRYLVNVILQRPKSFMRVSGGGKPRPPRQTKDRELILFDED